MNKELYKRALVHMLVLEAEGLKGTPPDRWMSEGRQSLMDMEILIAELRDEILKIN